jgi:hypothetical protein
VADIGIDIAVGTLCLALLAYAVKLTWAVSRIEKEQREYTDAQVDNLQRDLTEMTAGSVQRADSLRHEAGEMGAALRTKIHEVEVFSRDTFVRKDSFELVIGRLEKSMEKLGDRVEEKLEKFWERVQRP